MRHKLTKRQNEILALIQSHMQTVGSPPTRAEIAKVMGFRSPNAAEDHLRALARKGVIELVPGTSRGIRLVQTLGLPLFELSPKMTTLPEEPISQLKNLSPQLFNPVIDYMLQIKGQDLSGLNIVNGDHIAIHKTRQIKSGQMGLLRLNNELVIRRYSREIEVQHPQVEGLVLGIIRFYPLS